MVGHSHEEEDRREDIMSKAEDKYIDAMLKLKQTFPDGVCCVYFEIGGCEHGKACACGAARGLRGRGSGMSLTHPIAFATALPGPDDSRGVASIRLSM
eukprot:1626305-Prymnesium_polylepis.2